MTFHKVPGVAFTCSSKRYSARSITQPLFEDSCKQTLHLLNCFNLGSPRTFCPNRRNQTKTIATTPTLEAPHGTQMYGHRILRKRRVSQQTGKGYEPTARNIWRQKFIATENPLIARIQIGWPSTAADLSSAVPERSLCMDLWVLFYEGPGLKWPRSLYMNL